MPFSFNRRPELAGLDRRARSDVRRLAWHFAQRHWTLHTPAFAWLAFVALHTQFGLLPDQRSYLYATLVFFAVAVIVIRLHIARYLRAARAAYDALGTRDLGAILGTRR
ncbi:hypothetical protein P9239_03600 [Caballeronia sp. LZ062]|uniref:hypothetical protein n=1 Tax=unclassified Caballeronia TaxID=2646786 RepID=UPI0028651177|nr:MULTISPECIES: hypothetical protein [unclassified Caballeronia]MDR5857165.1 hypothetical protein [Caballeronia sp. LZ050]MDR5869439.1 hypothetical protein [Caballeronia sp. LZ062]